MSHTSASSADCDDALASVHDVIHCSIRCLFNYVVHFDTQQGPFSTYQRFLINVRKKQQCFGAFWFTACCRLPDDFRRAATTKKRRRGGACYRLYDVFIRFLVLEFL